MGKEAESCSCKEGSDGGVGAGSSFALAQTVTTRFRIWGGEVSWGAENVFYHPHVPSTEHKALFIC